jgi:glutaredoxin
MLVLWQFEQCEHSKPVRKKLTELGLDFVAINAPGNHPEKDAVMTRLFGNHTTPALWDTRTGALLQGTREVGDYIESRYGHEVPRD